MRLRAICAAMIALAAVDANAASFAIKNCSGGPITVSAYNGTDTLLVMPYNNKVVIIAHGQIGGVECEGVRCKLKVVYPGSTPANWADFYYSYDSCARYAGDAELQTFSNCVC